MNIKEARRALETIGNRGLEFGEKTIKSVFKNEYDLLNQFIADCEIALNNLNDAETILGDCKKEMDRLKVENQSLKQENERLNQWVLGSRIKINDLMKQSAVVSEALDEACNDMALSYSEEKEKYKKEYMKKAEESETTDEIHLLKTKYPNVYELYAKCFSLVPPDCRVSKIDFHSDQKREYEYIHKNNIETFEAGDACTYFSDKAFYSITPSSWGAWSSFFCNSELFKVADEALSMLEYFLKEKIYTPWRFDYTGPNIQFSETVYIED